MTQATPRAITLVEIDLDRCSLTYGVSPCTASIPSTGAIKCFNCLATCQDRENFDDEGVTLRFAVPARYLPKSFNALPMIKEWSVSPTVLSLGENLGQRAAFSVTLADAPSSDTGEDFDKYLADRDYVPADQGTFCGKLRARHPYMKRRAIRLRQGYLGQALGEFETRHFLIESFDGPRPNGEFTIEASDFLIDALGDRAQAPAPSNGYLSAAIDADDTVLTLLPAGIGNEEYPATGKAAIGGGEVVTFVRPYNADFLCHFDGADGATSATDEAGNQTLTFVGNAQIDTAQSVFGGASLLLDGVGDAVRLNGGALVTYGTGDYRWRLRFRLSALPASTASIFDFRQAASTDTALNMDVSNTGALTLRIGITGKVATTVVINTWYEMTVSRVGGTGYLFINGALIGSYASTDNLTCGANRPTLGERWDSNASTYMAGWFDEVQSKKGYGISAAYTPPASAFVYERGDIMEIVRGEDGTTAAAHDVEDRVQLCREWVGEDVAQIAYDLLTEFTDIDPAALPLADWLVETGSFLGNNYSALLTEPTAVDVLLSELVKQAGLVFIPDEVNQTIRLQVLRAISTAAAIFDEDTNIKERTLDYRDQQDRRLSQVWVFFARRDPTRPLDDENNYRSVSLTVDLQAESDYRGAGIEKIYSRWIPSGGRAIADRLGEIRLSRFVIPGRRVSFELMRLAGTDPVLGGGYRVMSKWFQDATGARVALSGQVTMLEARGDVYRVEMEEMIFSGEPFDPDEHPIIFDVSERNVDLYARHVELYGEPEAGNRVIVTLNAGVIIGSATTADPALTISDDFPTDTATGNRTNGSAVITGLADTADYAAGMFISGTGIPALTRILSVDSSSQITLTANATSGSGTSTTLTIYLVIIELQWNGRAQGRGGNGGGGGVQSEILNPGAAGQDGGDALLVEYPVSITYGDDAEIFAGAGGGAGGQGWFDSPGFPGGGGAGDLPGNNGATTEAGGPSTGSGAFQGGAGGDPGEDGAGAPGGTLGGAAGNAIDGVSLIRVVSGSADVRGDTIN